LFDKIRDSGFWARAKRVIRGEAEDEKHAKACFSQSLSVRSLAGIVLLSPNFLRSFVARNGPPGHFVCFANRSSPWRGSTITLRICDTGVARFPSSGGFAPALPQPRSSSAFAADSRAPAGASGLFMISARTAIASAACARARDWMSSWSVSALFMFRKLAVWRQRINPFAWPEAKLQDVLIPVTR